MPVILGRKWYPVRLCDLSFVLYRFYLTSTITDRIPRQAVSFTPYRSPHLCFSPLRHSLYLRYIPFPLEHRTAELRASFSHLIRLFISGLLWMEYIIDCCFSPSVRPIISSSLRCLALLRMFRLVAALEHSGHAPSFSMNHLCDSW